MDYKNAGVDIEAGYESVELMKKFVKGTMRPEVLGGLAVGMFIVLPAVLNWLSLWTNMTRLVLMQWLCV